MTPNFTKYISDLQSLSTQLEIQKDKSRTFYTVGKEIPSGQYAWLDDYTKIVANLDFHLQHCSQSNANVSQADQADFKNYILSDQNFLEKYALLSLQINPQDKYTYNFDKNGAGLDLISETNL